jgi:hypothetical protein
MNYWSDLNGEKSLSLLWMSLKEAFGFQNFVMKYREYLVTLIAYWGISQMK